MNYGTCRYCGQIVTLEFEEETQEAADYAASEQCSCPDAKHEHVIRQRIDAAKDRIRKIFGSDAGKCGFQPVAAVTVQMLENIAELTARGFITSAAVNIGGLGKAKITLTTKAKIKVERSETRSYQLED